MENKTGESLGYGFVKYNNAEDAARALLSMNNFRLQGKILLVKYSNPPKHQEDVIANTNLYVKPLLPSTTEGWLIECCFFTLLILSFFRSSACSFGPIDTVKVMVDKVTQTSRQIGFVRFPLRYLVFIILYTSFLNTDILINPMQTRRFSR